VTQSPVLSRFSNISLSETTTQSHLVVWRMAWQGFKERPVLGWGLENFNLIFNKYYEPILYKQEPWFDRAHNVFLDQLTANGILGLLAYLGLFAAAIYCLWFTPLEARSTKGRSAGIKDALPLTGSLYDSAILTSMFAAYFFHNLFVFDNLISLILFFSILAYIASRANLGANPVRNKTSLMSADLQKANRISNGVNSAYAIIISIAAIFLLYFINVPGLLASRALLNALQSSAQGDLPAAFQNFQKAINYNSFGSAEAREHLTNLSMQILSQPNLDNNFKQKVFDFSVSEMKKQIAQAPNDIRYMIFLASLYNKAGQYDNAIGVLNEAIELSPKKQALYFELGNSYLNKNDYDKALDVLRKAYELEPEFFEARKFYALAAIFAGKDDLAEDLMRDYGGTLYPDKSFIAAFAARKKFAQVAAIWEKILSQEPNNVQGHISLGATYLQMGEREKAIVQLQKAIELEPKFKEQGEYYIKEIRAGRNP
jgi:cytochrome c-type biogenesis protein CcmH/NrfG